MNRGSLDVRFMAVARILSLDALQNEFIEY